MSEIQREAARWGALYAGIVGGIGAIGEQIRAGFQLAQEASRATQEAFVLLDGRFEVEQAQARAREVSLRTALSYPEALRREVAEVLNPTRAGVARHRGWYELAAVIERQEGRRIVWDGLREVRVWLGEVDS